MYSLLIKNAMVIDGSGRPGQVCDVAVQGDKIANIDSRITSGAQTVVDAAGKILCPGFIDLQNHSDSYWQIFDNPQLDSLITQGITTILIGNCGASLAPLLSPQSLLSIQKWHSMQGSNINWQTFEEYLQELSKRRFGCNVASLVGYSTLRRGIVGDQVRSLEKAEFRALEKVLLESLDAGAFGLSSGLSYSHEIIISELELSELVKHVSKKNALFSIHLRSEGAEVVEAVEEALDIARSADLNMKISHLKIRNEQNWDKFEQVTSLIDTAYTRGQKIHFDVYPYDTIWQPLYSYLPKWAIEGGRSIMLKHFTDPVQRNKILMYLNNSGVRFPGMLIASTANKLNFTGKTIGQVAKNMEVSSEQAVLNLIQNGGSEVLVFEQNLQHQQVEQLLMHPLSFIGTDGAGFPTTVAHQLVHPRCFGTIPKFLKISMQSNVELEQIIKKLTLSPAKKLGLNRRGELKVGNFADLVVLNLDRLEDKSSYENPYQLSHGIEQVYVNGQLAVKDSKPTGLFSGVVLRKES